MKDEVVLFVGFDDKPYHEFLGERSGEEHFKAKGILFERWQVIHLGVPFFDLSSLSRRLGGPQGSQNGSTGHSQMGIAITLPPSSPKVGHSIRRICPTRSLFF